MAMLHARKAKQDVRLPAFVLESDNLDSYRPWLKRLREWTRKQGGRTMEAHLIGEEIPEEERVGEQALVVVLSAMKIWQLSSQQQDACLAGHLFRRLLELFFPRRDRDLASLVVEHGERLG